MGAAAKLPTVCMYSALFPARLDLDASSVSSCPPHIAMALFFALSNKHTWSFPSVCCILFLLSVSPQNKNPERERADNPSFCFSFLPSSLPSSLVSLSDSDNNKTNRKGLGI